MNEDKGTILNAAVLKLNASAESLAATMNEDIQPRALVVEEVTLLELDEKTNFNNDDLLLVSDQEGNTNKIQLSNLIGGGVAQGNKKAVSGETVKTTLDNYPTDSQVDNKINGALAKYGEIISFDGSTVYTGTTLVNKLSFVGNRAENGINYSWATSLVINLNGTNYEIIGGMIEAEIVNNNPTIKITVGRGRVKGQTTDSINGVIIVWDFINNKWEKLVTESKFKTKQITDTTSANGNINFLLAGNKAVVVSVQSYNDDGVDNDTIIIPYKLGDGKPDGGSSSQSAGRWGGHCVTSNGTMTVKANTLIHCTIHYYEI